MTPFEANVTITRVSDGQVTGLNSSQYATVGATMAVIGWLTNDSRTAAWGPFTMLETDQSNPWWKYSVVQREVKIGVGAHFNAGLWYTALATKNDAVIQPLVDEMGTYANGQNQMGPF